jgi:hypothetical protein
MSNSWRPDGWDKIKELDCQKCAFIDNKPSSDCAFCDRNFEAGADAMWNAICKLAEESPTKSFTISFKEDIRL